eukprot:GILJ01005064.1.p1 GENE.GILJ01005064.1~~GILJ01005064.1.p1  ORF type:complete len:725 (+),score=108.26 GILJ01005064.1:43-2175(+)
MAEKPRTEQTLAQLSSILELLKGPSDEQRFAGLLLLTKSSFTLDDKVVLRTVFDAIGAAFFQRLLRSASAYQSLALNILPTFLVDDSVAVQLQTLLQDVLELMDQECSQTTFDAANFDNLLNCLQALVRCADVHHLLSNPTLEILVKSWAKLLETYPVMASKLMSLMDFILKQCKTYQPRTPLVAANFEKTLLAPLSPVFAKVQTLVKFDLLPILSRALQVLSNWTSEKQQGVMSNASWPLLIRQGLHDILQSKLDPSRRDLALFLVDEMLKYCGPGWATEKYDLQEPLPTVEGVERGTFIVVLVNLVRVDLRVKLEQIAHDLASTISTTAQKSSEPMVGVLFDILERATQTLCIESERLVEDSEGIVQNNVRLISSSDLLLLRDGFVSTMQTLCEFLTIARDSGILTHPVVMASVRLLSVWVAEDTETITSSIYNLIPYILEVCDASHHSNPALEPLEFVLPALAQFTTDFNTRETLVSASSHVHVLSYLMRQIQRFISPFSSHSTQVSDRGSSPPVQEVKDFVNQQSIKLSIEILLCICASDGNICNNATFLNAVPTIARCLFLVSAATMPSEEQVTFVNESVQFFFSCLIALAALILAHNDAPIFKDDLTSNHFWKLVLGYVAYGIDYQSSRASPDFLASQAEIWQTTVCELACCLDQGGFVASTLKETFNSDSPLSQFKNAAPASAFGHPIPEDVMSCLHQVLLVN